MKQSGNALFLILIAVALFAALSYAVTQSGRGGGNIDRETRELNTAQVIQYASSVRTAVDKMRLVSGCSDTDYSFQNSSVAGYVNPTSPTDFSCHVFNAGGGGLTWQSPPPGINDGSDWVVTGTNRVAGISGTTALDLVMILPNVDLEVCEIVVSKLGGVSISVDPDFFNVTTQFLGTYGPTVVLQSNGEPLSCVRSTTSGSGTTAGNYYLYNVLIAR